MELNDDNLNNDLNSGDSNNTRFQFSYSGGKYGYKDASGNHVNFRQPTGNATADKVLSGYTFSNASGDGLVGSYVAPSSIVELWFVFGNNVWCYIFQNGSCTYKIYAKPATNYTTDITDSTYVGAIYTSSNGLSGIRCITGKPFSYFMTISQYDTYGTYTGVYGTDYGSSNGASLYDSKSKAAIVFIYG